MVNNITEIIEEIPELLQYFIPGFIFLKILSFLSARENHDASFFTIWSVIVSFLIKGAIEVVDESIFLRYDLMSWTKVVVCVVAGVVLAFVTYKIINSKWFSRFLGSTTKKSINADIWRDIVDYEKGTTFKVFLKNRDVVYTGKLIAHEEKGADSWFVFKEYVCTYLDKNEEFDSTEQEFPTTVAINLTEIERVELFYNKNTEIFE